MSKEYDKDGWTRQREVRRRSWEYLATVSRFGIRVGSYSSYVGGVSVFS